MQSLGNTAYAQQTAQASPPRRTKAIPLRPHTFRIDNAVYDYYGPIIGAIGYAVYCAYARYANRITGECFPGVDTIATQLDLSPPTVTKKRDLLAELGLLSFKERFGPSGRQTTHLTTVHTVDELEGRGKTGLPQDPAPRGKTDLPLSEQGDLTSSSASTEQEKPYTRRILEHSMDALKAVEQERKENDARQAQIRALDPQAYQALEAEARETLRNNPDVNLEFVMRSHLELVMYDLYQARQPAVEAPPTATEVPQEAVEDTAHEPVLEPLDVHVQSGSDPVAADAVGSTSPEPASADAPAGDPDRSVQASTAPGTPEARPAAYRPGPRAPRRRRQHSRVTATRVPAAPPETSAPADQGQAERVVMAHHPWTFPVVRDDVESATPEVVVRPSCPAEA